MVPAERPVSPVASSAPERALLTAVAEEYGRRGYRAYLDPDGTDYFDLAVRRGDEVGLLEGKVSGASEVLAQALRRRPWSDWVAVVLGSGRPARRLADRTAGRRAGSVGVWAVEHGRPVELRAPARRARDADPFAETRHRFRALLDGIDRGEFPDGVRWSGLLRAVRSASAGRGFAEWRLDEILPGDG
jgi:hypothetical protein